MSKQMWPVVALVALLVGVVVGVGIGRWSAGEYHVWWEDSTFIRFNAATGDTWIYSVPQTGWRKLPEGSPIEGGR